MNRKRSIALLSILALAGCGPLQAGDLQRIISALPSGAPVAPGASGPLAAGEVFPSIAAPGSIIYIRGSGFGGEVRVKVGAEAAEVLKVEPTRITAKLPGGLSPSEEKRSVVVTVGGTDLPAQSKVVISASAAEFGKVTTAGGGLQAAVFRLPEDTQKLPTDLATRTPHATFLAEKLDVPVRSFTAGFPGVDKNLVEWFAIRFTGKLNVAQAGNHKFRLNSDDGSKLSIDGKLVVDNDGIHATGSVEGAADLTAGPHAFQVEYFQGPATEIALQLFWTPVGKTAEEIVPGSAFGQPD